MRWRVCARLTMAESGRTAHKIAVSRRALLSAGAVILGSRSAKAQKPERTYRLGFVVQRPRHEFNALFNELSRLGFAEGRNLVVDARGFDRLTNGLNRLPPKLPGHSPTRSFAAARRRPLPGAGPRRRSRSWQSPTISCATGSSPRLPDRPAI